MPTVPSYGGPKVQQQGAPNVQVAPNAPSGAFGVQGPALPDLSGPQRVASQVEDEARNKADQVALLDAHVKLTTLRNSLLFDPQTGALNQRGSQAFGAAQRAQDAWQQGVGAIEGNLASDTQKQAFRQQAAMQWGQVSATVESHVSQQAHAFDADRTDAALKLAADDAVRFAGDDQKVQGAIAQGKVIAEMYAERNGYSPEQTKSWVDGMVSTAHRQVIESLTDQENDQGAQSYFQQHHDELQGHDLIEAEKLVGAGSIRAESQRQADTITSASTNLSDAVRQAHAIQDPRVRDATETRVRRYYEDQAADQRIAQAQAFHDASAILETTGDFSKVPLKLRSQMSPEENEALQHREDQLRHPVRVTNVDTYTSLMNMAGLNAGTRQVFEQTNLAPYRNQLSEEDFHALTKLQLSLRLGTMTGESRATRAAAKTQAEYDKAAGILRGYGTKEETIQKTLGPRPALPTPQGIQPPSVPGAPIPVPADTGDIVLPSAPGATPKPISMGPTTGTVGSIRGSVQQHIPRSYLEYAKQNPDYQDYLEHMGFSVEGVA